MFVDPDQARTGAGRALLRAGEQAIAAAGFAKAHLVATFSGRDFYLREGYVPIGDHEVPLPGGGSLGVTAMERILTSSSSTRRACDTGS
jgi:predicted N-acetyltransferase YhbS